MTQALGLGHHVRAFARNPAAISDIDSPELEAVQGDVLNGADVERAVADCDAVLMAIGARSKRSIVRERRTENDSLRYGGYRPEAINRSPWIIISLKRREGSKAAGLPLSGFQASGCGT